MIKRFKIWETFLDMLIMEWKKINILHKPDLQMKGFILRVKGVLTKESQQEDTA